MNVFWLMIIAAMMFLLQLVLFRLCGQKGISYDRFLSKDYASVGEEIDMIEEISLRRIIPALWVRAESRIPSTLVFARQADLNVENEMFHRSLFTLMPYRKINRRYHLMCTHRGIYSLDTVTLTTGDLIGLYMSHKTIILNTRVIVYPKILSEDSESLPSKEWQGSVSVRRWIQPDPFLVNGIRRYQIGDNPRDIHAGATAKTGELQVKTHDYTIQPRVLVLFNVQLSQNQYGIPNPIEKESMEYPISQCATLITWCRNRSVPFGFGSNGTLEQAEQNDILLMPDSGQVHYETCMEMLARLQVIRRVNFLSCFEEIHKQSGTGILDIVVYSCYWTDEMEKAADTLRIMGHTVTYMHLDRREVEQNATH